MSDWVPLSAWKSFPRICGVYVIRHSISGKEYIGQSVNVRTRLGLHHRGASSSLLLRRAIAAHGLDQFECCLLVIGERTDMLREEVATIAARRTLVPEGYNLTEGGEGSIGYKLTPEQCAKVSAAGKGKPKSAETRARMSQANRERPPEHWEQVAAKTRARVVSAETRAKQSQNAKTRPEKQRRQQAAKVSRAVWVWLPDALTPLRFESGLAAAKATQAAPSLVSRVCQNGSLPKNGHRYYFEE